MSVSESVDPDFAAGVRHSLQEAFDPERVLYQLLKQIQAEQRVLQASMTEMKETMIRWEAVVADVGSLKDEIKDLKKEIATLKEEKQQRAGMRWLMEWSAKYVPWLAAAAASIWAIRGEK